MNRTLEHFVDGSFATMVVLQKRYGVGYVAFVGPDEFLSDMADGFTGGDCGMEDLCHGILATDWYPVGEGDTIREAVEAIHARVEGYLNDEKKTKLWEYAYSMVSTRLYMFNKEHRIYVLVKPAKARNLPDWIKTFDTVTEELIEAFADQLDAGAAE